MTTVWGFLKRGDWATHDAKWCGNWSPYIPRNILLRYAKEIDLVLDQFAGGGTTLVEAKLLNRNIIGIDVNDAALARCRDKISFEYKGADGKVDIHKGDARNLDFIVDESIDLMHFLARSPPLLKWRDFGCVRFIYNRMLSDKIKHYEETKQKLNNTPAQYKNEFDWLKEVDSLALANAQMNLLTAYRVFEREAPAS